IRLECTELIKIFHTINPQDQTSKESPQKIDPTLAKNILTGLEEASNSIDLGASSATKKLLKNLRNIILQANSIELSTLETHLIQLTSLQTDQSPNKVKISFDWDGILIPKDSANALQSILATFIKNSINLNTRISIQHQDAKELVSNNILIKARTLEIGVEFSLIGDQWIIQKNPELTHFFESFKIDNIQLISSPKPGIRLQFQLKYNPQKSTHKI
ncbi:MAG: hypothetical protein NTX25_21585, partial [Proteobacteria bacterium]|nr:hypothetical protein [Pseudomonadota bacterium]